MNTDSANQSEAPELAKSDPFLSEISWRGVFHQCSDLSGLADHLRSGSRRAYIGLDPTADSLTIGNLATLKLLAHFQRAGHQPFVVAGGGTGLIGDPGGKSAERPLQSLEQVRSNVESQLRIYNALLPGAPVLNNADWLVGLSYIEMLRDVGKHFSVNEMIKRDTVRNRLEADGISYTEFSYMLLQSYDFAHLYKNHGVTLQMGGSDQWGNIVSGVDLVRRLHGGQAYALTGTLVVKADGTKFGKSEAGAIWLTADRTSPYAFHQFWLNTHDSDVIGYLNRFTFLTRSEISQLAEAVSAKPGEREAQRVLADEVCAWLHGPEATSRAKQTANALFTGNLDGLEEPAIEALIGEIPTVDRSFGAIGQLELAPLLVELQVAKSNREAREWLTAGSMSLNGQKIGIERTLNPDDKLFGKYSLFRRGKKNWSAVRWTD